MTAPPIDHHSTGTHHQLLRQIPADRVNLVQGSVDFADPNVGTWPVTFSGYSISGADAADYTLTQPTSNTADITPATLQITATPRP